MLAPILPNIPGLSEEEARAQGRISDEQEAAIVRVLAEPTRAALIASEVGLGKTLVASEVVLRAGWSRVLLIGIIHTHEQWDATFQRQSRGAVSVRKMDSTKAGRAVYADFLAGKPAIYFAGIQWLQAQDWDHRDKTVNGHPVPVIDKKTGLPTGKNQRERIHLKTFAKMSARKGGGLDAVIFDEAHQVSSKDSIGRRTLLTFKGHDGEPWKIGLSATWSGNSFENAWSLPRWLWPDTVPAYWAWHGIWCATETQYIGRGKSVQTVIGEKEPEGSFVKTLPCYIRHERTERPPEPVKIYVDSTPQQRAQYDDLVAELLTWAQNWEGEREPLVVDVPAVLDARLKQVALAELSFDEKGDVVFADNAPSAKLHALRGVLDKLGEQPVIIFAAGSEKFAALTAKRMVAAGYSAALWTGRVKDKDRKQIKADFMAGRIRYIVGTPESMGTGTDGLQLVCSKVVWLASPDGSPVMETQGVGRVFRPGMTTEYGPMMDIRVLMRDSIDVEKLEALISKGRAMRASISA